MSDVVVVNEDNIVVVADSNIPDTVVVSEDVVSVIHTTEQGQTVVVKQPTMPDQLTVTTGGSAYINAVEQGFVGTEAEWLSGILDDKASVSWVVSAITDSEQSLATRIDTVEAAKDANTSQINNLSQAQADETQARADEISALQAQMDSDIIALNNTINSAIATSEAASAQARNDLEASLQGEISALNTSLRTVITTTENSLSQDISNLNTSFDNRINAEVATLNQAFTDADNAIAQSVLDLEAEFDLQAATISQNTTAIANESIARADDISQVSTDFNNLLSSEVATLNQSISDEASSRATAIQGLTAQVDNDINANTTLIQQVDVDVQGNASAISGIRTAVAGTDSQSAAELQLTSTVSRADEAWSRAYLGVNSTVNGVTTVNGITVDGQTNSIELRTGTFILADNDGNPKLEWDTGNNTYVFRGKIILNDGTEIDDASQVPTGPSGAGIYYGSGYGTISWLSGTANSRFNAVANRAPIFGDHFTQEDVNDNFETRMYDGTDWIGALLVVHGNIIADGTIGGDKIIAGTSIQSPNIIGGTLKTATSGYRVEAGNSGYPIWYGTGTVNGTNGLFYVTDSGSVVAKNITIDGDGTFSGTLDAANGTFSGELQAATGTFNGTLAANSVTATNLTVDAIFGKTLRSGKIEMIGSSYMKVQSATPFGPHDLIEWYGPIAGNLSGGAPIYSNLTKTNAITYLDDAGNAYFGGSIIAGTISTSKQTSSLSSTPSISTGLFGSNGGQIKIICSFSGGAGTATGSGSCPTHPNPSVTLTLKRIAPSGTVTVHSETFNGTYTCIEEGAEHNRIHQVNGSFSFYDNINTTQDREYLLEATVSGLESTGKTQRLAIVAEEA